MDSGSWRLARAAAVTAGLATALAAAASAQPPPEPPPAAPSPNACLRKTGSRSWCGDGGAARAARLAGPSDVAVAPEGSVLIADTLNNVIRRVSRDGTMSSIAGTGEQGAPPGGGGPAAEVAFDGPQGVAVAADGDVLLADTGNGAIRSISAEGIVSTLVSAAGPTVADLDAPGDVAVAQDGGLLIADSGHHRVLHVTPSGDVEDLAGTGEEGYSGDGGDASSARLSRPTEVSTAPAGATVIADAGNRVLRRVSASGAIETMAQQTTEPTGVLALPDGATVVADAAGLDRIEPDGTRHRIAGGAERGFDGDDGAALSLRFDGVRRLALADDGRILFAERRSDRVRFVDPSGFAGTLAGSGVPIKEAVLNVPAGSPPKELKALAKSAQVSACERYDPRFATFSLIPLTKRTIKAKRPGRVRLRYTTSRRANVVIELFRGGKRVGVKKQARVSRAPHRIKVRGAFVKRKSYLVKLWGESVPGGVLRCDVKRVKVR